jgi:hypothetical protein
MIKQVLSLVSLIFVGVCIVAIAGQFVNMGVVWASFEHMYHFFDRDGELEIVSMPAGAAIYINNKFIGQTPFKEKRAGGAYDVKLILEGYQTYARKITIDKKTPAIVHARLSKEYGVLHINSTPSNATVFIDGKRQGQLTPLELKVPLGKYHVRVVKDRFYTFEEDAMVEDTSPTTIEADLVRQVGRLILETLPSGAKAYIGNDVLGTTPLTQDKPVGKYVITLKKPGFRDKVLEANIAPDESLEIHIEMDERSGSLKVTTNPPGAEVHINDVYQGESPVRLEKKPQVYQLLIKKSGYREINEEIVIEDNITKNIHRDLDPVLGELHIDSNPPHAKVWLNSEYVGYTPIRSNVSPGIYTVRITKPGYRNFVEEIHVKEEAFKQLKPDLEKEQ